MVWKGLIPEKSPEFGSASEAAALSLGTSGIIEQLFQLLTIFQADRAAVAQFNKDMPVVSSRGDPLVELRLALTEPVVTKLLIETAIKNRWRADALIATHCSPDRQSSPWSVNVGHLSENGDRKHLSLRESCNKIIHADKIEAQFVRNEGSRQFLNGIILTTGSRQESRWEAEIDIANYVRASLFNTYGAIDFPRGWIRI
jgi:hypothetical protein